MGSLLLWGTETHIRHHVPAKKWTARVGDCVISAGNTITPKEKNQPAKENDILKE